MSEPDPGVSADAAATVHHALVGLHALAGDLDTSTLPGFHPPPNAGAQLRAVAAADESEVPISARVGVLYRLAKAGFPRYETDADAYGALAASVAQARGLDGDQLLSDLKESANEGVPFETTTSGQALPHHEAAFVSSDVCTTRRVSVGGLDAVWVFSEFETDAPFEQVAEWVDPHHWPERGPMLFRSMAPVGPGQPVTIPGDLGSEHWHGVFHEEVQLVSRLNTLLHCDFWRDGDVSAGMTYDLDLSLDGQINVDRGFLLVNDLGPMRRVKALKVVGFTADIWDDVAELVCPFWTDWVRGAVRGGTTSTPHPPVPDSSGQPDAHGGGGAEPGDLLEAWVRFFGSAARDYLEMATDTGTRMRAGGYSASDWLDDGTRYWSKLAKDWARAWTYGLDALGEMAREGADAGLAPPGTDPGTVRGLMTSMTAGAPGATTTPLPVEVTTIPVAGLSPDDQPVVSRLVSIEAGGTSLPSTDVTVSVVTLPDGSAGVRLGTTNTVVPAGLYVGVLQSAQGRPLAPVQLYVSRASGGSTP